MRFAAFALLLYPLLPCCSIATAEESLSSADQTEFADNALFRYVAKPDDSYRWTKRREGKIGKGTYVELTLTSQTWRGITWKHQLFIVKPSTMKQEADHALLVIEGSNWHAALAEPTDSQRLPREAPVYAKLAEQLGTPLAVLLQVPHQPILDGKVEDQAIAYTFEQFLRTQDDTWPLLLPMTKSAVRAMDAVTEFAQQEWNVELKEFTVTGASKRGWTTWLVGAVDPRATAIAPMVIDTLNMAEQMPHQLAVWGGYSSQIRDYTERGLQKHLSTEGGKALREIVDPYSFRSVLKQPKLIILGTNDPYWPLDALDFYWNDLAGPKYVLYVPNNGHGLNDYPRLIGSIAALHRANLSGEPLPELDWDFSQQEDKLSISMQTDTQPERVRVWLATSKTRDFRQARWIAADVEPTEAGRATYSIEIPSTGYLAMFGEWQFSGESLPYFLSTNVRVVSRGLDEPRP